MAVRIITDSTASLNAEEITRYDIIRVALYLVSDGVAESEIGMDVDAFYARLDDMDTLPTSAQPTPASFKQAFTDALDAGDEALGIFMSGSLSGTCEGARMIVAQIERERPDATGRLAIIDSKSTSRSLSYPVLAAARAAKDGADLQTCTDIAEYTTACTRFIFAPLSLEYLRRGGRIGRASALLGTALKLAPVLGPDRIDGTVHTYAKVRTFQRALTTLKDKMFADSEVSGGLKDICVHYIREIAPAEAFREKVIVPLCNIAVPPVFPVSPVVGAHVGPAVGLAYVTNQPVLPENVGGFAGGGIGASLASGLENVSERFQALRQKVGEKVEEYVHSNKGEQ
jgi:DegV family protein with EDD domain